MPNNKDRAEFVAPALELFQEATGSDDDTAAGDFICDLLHFEQQNGRDPLQAIRNGLANFICEISDAHEDGMYAEARVELDLSARAHATGAEWRPWDMQEAARLRKESRKEMALNLAAR